FFLCMTRRPPSSTPFPYTTLFRSFHPEVVHTPLGSTIIGAFLFDVAGLSPTWTPGSFTEEAVALVRAKVGPTDHAICGLSGGVEDRKSTRLNSSHDQISYAVFCLK